MFETILGGIVGGIARLAPEVLNFLDRREERKHELALGKQQMEMAQLQQQGALAKADLELQQAQFVAAMATMKAGIEAQGKPSGVKWVDGWAAAVRPAVTSWVFLIYAAYKTASIYLVFKTSAELSTKVTAMWGAEDSAMLSAILTFWFVGRVWERVQPRITA